jgi:ubiquinol-cytochrome c reductase cytochrome c subunit
MQVRFVNRSVARISRHRRNRLAGFVVMAFGLLAMGGLYAAVSPAQAQQTVTTAEQVEEGRQLFTVNCSSCHGLNGEGIRTDGNGQLGPSLVGVGAAAVDFQVGTGRMPMAAPGQQAPVKPVVFTDEEREALAAFVASLGPGPAIPDESDYSTAGMSEEEREEAIVRGGQIWFTNCTACHNFDGASGAMPRGGKAPSLHETSPKNIYQAMLTGPGPMDNFSDGNISPEDKRAVIAYIESIREEPEAGGFALGAIGPVAEGLFTWLGIGVLVVFTIWIAAHTTRSDKEKAEA